MSTDPTPEVRHMSSSPTLLATPNHKVRPLQPTTQPRLGSRSPTSIPSSPTSVHSSTSAIFERDIEPLPQSVMLSGQLLASPPLNPHRTARAKQSEALDQAVPSVLSSAASALSAISEPPRSPSTAAQEDPFMHSPPPQAAQISVIAPSHILPTSSLPSPVGRGSRSPSPTTAHPPAPFDRQASLPPQMPGAYASVPPSRASTTGSPFLAPAPGPPLPLTGSPKGFVAALPPPLPASVHDQSVLAAEPGELAGAAAVPGRASNRLSFISYNDMLLDAPVATVSLGSITQPASDAFPPHLPGVEQSMTPGHAHLQPPSPGSRSRPRSAVFGAGSSVGQRASLLLEKDLGGEWEREGLGRGLEERLEALLKPAGVPVPAA